MLAAAIRVTQAVLALLCAYLVYGVIEPFLGTPTLAAASVPTPEAITGDPVDSQSYKIIADRNLFRTVEKAPPPVAQQESIEDSQLDWKVHIIAAASIAEMSVAIVSQVGDPETRAVRIGDQIGAASVEQIERGGILVRHGGKLERIALAEAAAGRGISRARAATAAGAKGRARTRAAARRRASRPARRRPIPPSPSIATPTSPDRAVRQSNPPPPATAMLGLDEIGLAPGESIASVNGISVTDPGRFEDLVLSMSSGAPMSVRIIDAAGGEREIEWEGSP